MFSLLGVAWSATAWISQRHGMGIRIQRAASQRSRWRKTRLRHSIICRFMVFVARKGMSGPVPVRKPEGAGVSQKVRIDRPESERATAGTGVEDASTGVGEA
ncbi:hypothetical protein BS50DRAFT_319176 [Corynespora cassiicola Philippines]|uniref:Uncharacterized protein n=1 Tax=Corynespora cassiicola Philippines TaxID=1448308 RepID=A0A2T2NTC2_CORCC|nr:hypothetical protein BS50DRAFT_319176 [Corynespora cassiicola Philippines]